MSNFNYHDEIKNGNTSSWISFLNRHYINTTAPEVKIFKLEKKDTKLDDLYNTEDPRGGRIYLPPFPLRAYYLDQTWTQNLGSEMLPFQEKQEDTSFAVNFEDMVQTIRDLKQRKRSELFIEYNRIGEVTFQKNNNIIIVKVNDKVIKNFNLEDNENRTTEKLKNQINLLPGFTCTLEGQSDISTNLVSFRETRFQNKKLNIYSFDDTYANSTDIIEPGDLILTEKFFVYEVESNIPGGNFGWDFSMMILTGNTASLADIILPNNWNEVIRKNEYGIRNKIRME